MNPKLIGWASVALVTGLLVGYLTAASGLAVLKQGFADKTAELEARSTEAESAREKLAQELKERQKGYFQLIREMARIKEQAAASERHFNSTLEKMQQASHGVNGPLSVSTVATIANSFHDIQHEVAAGKYPGLSVTNGYQRLKEILDTPDMERFLADYDTLRGK